MLGCVKFEGPWTMHLQASERLHVLRNHSLDRRFGWEEEFGVTV